MIVERNPLLALLGIRLPIIKLRWQEFPPLRWRLQLQRLAVLALSVWGQPTLRARVQ